MWDMTTSREMTAKLERWIGIWVRSFGSQQKLERESTVEQDNEERVCCCPMPS
jgi:hypothetical protein